jgi:hypothetical protein
MGVFSWVEGFCARKKCEKKTRKKAVKKAGSEAGSEKGHWSLANTTIAFLFKANISQQLVNGLVY